MALLAVQAPQDLLEVRVSLVHKAPQASQAHLASLVQWAQWVSLAAEASLAQVLPQDSTDPLVLLVQLEILDLVDQWVPRASQAPLDLQVAKSQDLLVALALLAQWALWVSLAAEGSLAQVLPQDLLVARDSLVHK